MKTMTMAQRVLQDDFINDLCDFYSCEHDGMYKNDYTLRLTKNMIVDGIKLLVKETWFKNHCNELTRENCKAWFAMIYPEIWAYKECGYGIGYMPKSGKWNKKMEDIRIKAEIIWNLPK
jgi:hypothetical protein